MLIQDLLKYRMDWGLGNPNKTAALIAMLLILVSWFVFYYKSKKVLLVVLCSFLFVCLVLTGSRGGIVALFFGLWPLLLNYFKTRGLRLQSVLGLTVGALAIGAFMWKFHLLERYTQNVFTDESVLNRLTIWREFPSMVWSALGGWGLGNSGNAFMQWYQPVGRMEEYRTLVNSHLGWGVEFGWLFRVIYVFSWGFIVMLLMKTGSSAFSNTVLGIWISFFFSSFFSSVAEAFLLWLIPLATFAIFVILNFKRVSSAACRAASVSFFFSVLFLALIICLGFFMDRSRGYVVKKEDRVVRISSGNGEMDTANIWSIVSGENEVLGRKYGHEIRRFISSSIQDTSFEIYDLNDMDLCELKGVVVASGIASFDFETISDKITCHPGTFILFNPKGSPEEFFRKVPKNAYIRIVWGEFYDYPRKIKWLEYCRNAPESDFMESQGSAYYVSDWIDFIEIDQISF